MTQQTSGNDSMQSNQPQSEVIDNASLASRLEVSFPKRKSIFYSVTEAEINLYAQLSWLATIFLTLFGAFSGIAFGSLIALLQPNLPDTAIATLTTVTWICGIVSLIFLVLAIILIVLQSKGKKAWEPVE